MSTFTRKPGQPWRCDACKAPVGDTWPQKVRHHVEHHTPAHYWATRRAQEET